MWACNEGYTKIVKLLAEAKADPDISDKVNSIEFTVIINVLTILFYQDNIYNTAW